MKLRRSVKQCIVLLLSFLMAFEPFAINMARANDGRGLDAEVTEKVETPEAVIETMDVDADDNSVFESWKEMANKGENQEDSLMKPVDYLYYMYSLRGRSKGDSPEKMALIENALAWGEWMNTITGAYSLMDDGCTDVFSYYNTLGMISTHATNAPEYLKAMKYATNKALLAGAFIAKVTHIADIATKIANSKFIVWLKSKGNLMKGFNAMGKFFGKGLQGADTFISHLSPPAGFRKGCGSGEGFASYWRWITKKGTSGDDVVNALAESSTKMTWNQFQHANAGKGLTKAEISQAWKAYKEGTAATTEAAEAAEAGMSNVAGVAHTIGIGLTIIGIACDAYGIFSSEDRQGGRYGSYALVKNYVGLALGVGSLIAMFCIPVVGQVLAVITLVWTALTAIADQIGKYNKKWKEAYKNSFWFLYQNDPNFKSFYELRDELADDEKSAAYIITERNYGDYRKAAREFERNNKNENSYYDDMSETAVNSRVFIELEKQGVLTSYYNRATFKLPDFGMARLLELWEAKADYMAWKPTEEESVRAQNRGFWGKIGHAINPMTYVSWVGDKINSIKYNKLSKQDIDQVCYNPDFVLMKKYQAWVTANRLITNENEPNNNNGFYRMIGLRIEQAPFNYIPLVGIDMASWSNDVLVQAFNADSFLVGLKEMMYFRNMIGAATNSVKEFTKNVSDEMKELKNQLEYFDNQAEALVVIRDAYRYDKDSQKKGKELLKNKYVKKVFKWNTSDKYTPKEIVALYWNDIDRALSMDVSAISQKGAEVTLLLETIKRNINLSILMQELYEEKLEAINNVDQEFTNLEFNEFIKKGSFLTVKGGGVLDWLSGIYPPVEELEKYNNLYKKEIDKFSKAAEDSSKGHKKLLGFLWRVEDERYNPNTVLGEINMMLDKYRKVSEDFQVIAPELSKDGLTISDTDEGVYPMKDGTFVGYPTNDEIETIDPEAELKLDDIMPAPQGATTTLF